MQRALHESSHRQLVVAGGVGANKSLRIGLQEWIDSIGGAIYFPALEYCTDNGAMIAYAGCLRMLRGEKDLNPGIEVRARWPLA